MRILFLKSMTFVAMAAALSWGIVANAQPVCPEGQTWNACTGTSVGPAPCVPGCVGVPVAPPSFDEPTGPNELCLPEGCQPVSYTWAGNLVVAESRLENGYPVMGWSGPCLALTRGQCPDIKNQAFADLRLAALRAHRAQRYE